MVINLKAKFELRQTLKTAVELNLYICIDKEQTIATLFSLSLYLF